MLRNILKKKNCMPCLRHWFRNLTVRFAPSPTGNIHLGGLRTALLNYLFVKKNNGKFILRLEDTDQSRVVQGSAENLEKILGLVGIIPDEGPLQGGPSGPYIQSQRLDIYQNKIKDLINARLAYKCFCTESRLDIIRKEQTKRRETPGYDNSCRHLSQTELEKLEASKTPYCIRLKLEDGPQTFSDLVYGEVTLTIGEGDTIILKTDGYPTYHFACVVDDHLMGVTHVLRGVEWLVSTPKHLQLYKAFGWKPPEFAHLPLLLNRDGSKLSKRHGDIDIQSFLNRGFYPQAILNLVASTGGGFGQLYDGLPTLSLSEMVEKFEFNKVNVNSCKIDLDKLQHFNKDCLENQIQKPQDLKRLAETFEGILHKHFDSGNIDVTQKHLEHVLQWGINTGRISTLYDLLDPLNIFLWKKPALKLEKFQKHDGELLRELLEILENLPGEEYEPENLRKLLKEISDRKQYKYSSFMHLLRFVLSEQKTGPSVIEMLEMLGRSEALNRLREGASVADKVELCVSK